MPDKTGGYVRIYRSILDNPTFRNVEEAMFFAFLVLRANWTPGERRYDDRIYKLERGDLVIGERKLAEEFGWTRKKVRGVISRLEATDMITRKRAQHGCQRAPVITICNYSLYQDVKEAPNQGGAQAGPKAGPPNKEGKEGKVDNTVASLTARQFEEFWRIYPSRKPHSNPRKTALAKFEAAVGNGAAASDIIRGAENYAAYIERERPNTKYVAQAATWLYQERWTDYQEEAAPAPAPLML